MAKFGISCKITFTIAFLVAFFAGVAPLSGQAKPEPNKPEITTVVPVAMTVSLSVPEGKQTPAVSADDLTVKQGKTSVKVTGWTPLTGERDALSLYILIDDAADPVMGSHLDDVRGFINHLAPSAQVGVGYMRDGVTQIAQDFTADHGKAAAALRMPTGQVGVYGSPYLSVIDLMKRWPKVRGRREIVMFTDGIDRARRRFGVFDISTDVDTAVELAQRSGILIHTVYVPGYGRFRRNYWEANTGQISISKLSDETGGESYFLGFQNPVSLAPYLEDLQKLLGNQYLLRFEAVPGKSAGLQPVSVSTSVAGVEISSAGAVWVPVTK